MGRNINTASSASKPALEGKETGLSEVGDNYAAEIVKLIPTKIVGVYLGLQNLVNSLAQSARYVTQLIFFITILGIESLYLKSVGRYYRQTTTNGGHYFFLYMEYLTWRSFCLYIDKIQF